MPVQPDSQPSPTTEASACIVLRGTFIQLEPLQPEHAPGLLEAALDGDLWKSNLTIIPRDLTGMLGYIADASQGRDRGDEIPYAIRHLPSGRLAGSTRIRHWVAAHRRAEIGPTFIGRSFQRTAVNPESKLLLLRHAFEAMRCIRIEIIADVFNQHSIGAILKLGASQEGVLRQHLVMPDGRLRDSALFSILDTEWPAIRARLQARLEETPSAPQPDTSSHPEICA